MEQLELIPLQRCGKLSFGMSEQEAEAAIGKRHTPWESVDVGWQEQTAWFGENYHLTFVDGCLEWAEVDLEALECTLHGIALHSEKAEDIVRALAGESPCRFDGEDAQRSCTVYFEQLGLTLWRSRVYHPLMMEDADYAEMFREMPPDLQADELRFWHFQSAALESARYRQLRREHGVFPA